MHQKLERLIRRLRDSSVAELGYGVTAGLLIAIGVFFRSRRYWIDPIGLWGDEASWARRLFHPSWTDFEFRPIGYMDVTKLAVHVYSDERTIRILSYAAGLASLFIVLDAGKYLFRTRTARLLCLTVVAFQPVLIDMSREFKPYSLELCAHLALIWLFLRWHASGSRRWLCALLLCSSLSFLFAYNIVFLLPAIFGLLGGDFLRERAFGSFLTTAFAACAALALIATLYFSVLSAMHHTEGAEQFWGGKYDVFYLRQDPEPGQALQGRATWLAHKYGDLAVFPDTRHDRWKFPEWTSPAVREELGAVSYFAWLTLHAVGLVALFFPRRRQALVLLVTPLVLTMLFNAFGVWPFGPFRANTFLLAYYCLIPMVGLDALIAWTGKFGWVFVAAGYALILVPDLTVGFDSHARKHSFTGHMETRAVLRRLRELRERAPAAARAEKSYVLLDWYSCAPFEFEATLSDSARREFGPYLVENFALECVKTAKGAQAFVRKLHGKSFFVVVTDDRAKHAIRGLLQREATLMDEEEVRKTHDLYYATGN